MRCHLLRLRSPGGGPFGAARGLAAAAVVLGLAAAPAFAAEETDVSPDVQVPIIMRILAYDRNLESRAGAEVTVGIVYAPADPQSVKEANAVSDAFYRYAGKTVKRLPIRYVLLEYTTPENLERSVATRGIDVLYVAPGNAQNLAGITRVSQARSITTTTGVPDYVRRGISVGVGRSQERAQILINLTSSRAEGCEFDASLLRIATVVK
jgi:hypothetical protein